MFGRLTVPHSRIRRAGLNNSLRLFSGLPKLVNHRKLGEASTRALKSQGEENVHLRGVSSNSVDGNVKAIRCEAEKKTCSQYYRRSH